MLSQPTRICIIVSVIKIYIVVDKKQLIFTLQMKQFTAEFFLFKYIFMFCTNKPCINLKSIYFMPMKNSGKASDR